MTWREGDHPRHPAGSPGGRGGEWRARTGGWATQVVQRLGFGPRDELVHVLKNGIKVNQTDLTGGESAQVRVVDFEMPDGSVRRLVRKRHASRGEAHTEANASILAEAVGAPIEPTEVDTTNSRVTWTPLVDGRSLMEMLVIAYHGGKVTWAEAYSENEELYFEAIQSERYYAARDTMADRQASTDRGRLLGVFDMLSHNTDRHEGNWLVLGDGSPVGIDHTHLDTSEVADTELGYWTDSPFARHFMWGDRVPEEGYGAVAVDGLADNDMHPDDMELIRRRIAALYESGGAFADEVVAGSPFYRESIESRLKMLTTHATGTRRRLS